MEKLETAKREALEKLQQLESGSVIHELPAELADYRNFLGMIGKLLDEAPEAEMRAKIVSRLVHRVEVGTDGVTIHYYAGQESISGENSPDFFDCEGSSSLTSGAGRGT